MKENISRKIIFSFKLLKHSDRQCKWILMLKFTIIPLAS